MGASTVQLMPTCLAGEIRPEVAEAAVTLLRAMGLHVQVPRDVVCCGQPAFNAGFRPEARRVAKHDVARLRTTEGPIVLPSGSCAHTMTHAWGDLLDGTDDVAVRVHELSAFIVARGGLSHLRFRGSGRVAYHASCHLLRGMGIDDAPRALLGAIEGMEVVELERADECCGFGGSFSVERASISSALADRKLAAIQDSGAEIVTGCDISCLLHLEGRIRRLRLPIRVVHLAQLLAESLA